MSRLMDLRIDMRTRSSFFPESRVVSLRGDRYAGRPRRQPHGACRRAPDANPGTKDFVTRRLLAVQRGRPVVIVYSSNTVARAAMPSPLPVKPRPSVVVALTLTRATSISSADAMDARIA